MKKIIILSFITLLCSCTSMQVSQPKTFNETYAIAKTTLSILLEADHISHVNGVIPIQTEAYVLKVIQNSNELLEDAKILSTTDLTSANGKLNAAIVVITSLQSYMNTQGIFQGSTPLSTTTK